jgi:hypothetical protein
LKSKLKSPTTWKIFPALGKRKDYEEKATNLITPQSLKYPSRWTISLTRICKTYTYKMELWPYKPTGCNF